MSKPNTLAYPAWWGLASETDPRKNSGWSEAAKPVYHLARAGTGTRSVCGRIKHVLVADHVIDGPLCGHCQEQLNLDLPAVSVKNKLVAQAIAEFVRRMFPFYRMTSHEVASLVSLFCASYFDRGYGHPRHQEFVEGVYQAALRRLDECETEEPRLTKTERLWRVKQAVKRRAPRVDFVTWADRWRRNRMQRERKEHEEAIRVYCRECGELPDECTCEREDELDVEILGKIG